MRHLPRVLGIVLPLFVLACEHDVQDEPVGPHLQTLASETGTRAYYLHLDEPVHLDIDPSSIVVAAGPVSDAALADVVREAAGDGPQVAAPRELAGIGGHRIVPVSGLTEGGIAALVTALRADPSIPFVSPTYRTVAGGSTVRFLNRMNIRFEESTPGSRIDSLIAAESLQVLRPPRPDSGYFAYRLGYPRGADPLLLTRELHALPFVKWASPSLMGEARTLSMNPSDEYYSDQWYLENDTTLSGVPIDINPQPAWAETMGLGVRVAVLDRGVEIDHPEFSLPYRGLDMFDPIGSSDNALNPLDDDAHGTAVAGIIKADHNTEGIAGVAPEIDLSSIRIFRGGTVLSCDSIADAMNLAWAPSGEAADVIVNSWLEDTPCSELTDAIANALTEGRDDKGAVVVFAAGNPSDREHQVYGDVVYPARLTGTMNNLISASAINRSGGPANYAPRELGYIDIVAPSGHEELDCFSYDQTIVTTDRTDLGDEYCGGSEYVGFSGSSAAAPMVGAAAALLLAEEPTLTVAEVKARLIQSADHEWSTQADFGAGKLNIGAAIAPPPSPPSVTISGPSSAKSDTPCEWTADVTGTGPFGYSWFSDGPGASQWTATYSVSDTGDSDFTLELWVTDPWLQTDADTLQVAVSPFAPACPV